MPSYTAPVTDTLFVLDEVIGIGRLGNVAGYAEATPDVVRAVLEEGAKLCEEVLQPLNRVGDRQGCRRNDDGSVTTPDGFADAYRAYAGGGWVGIAAHPGHGGQGLPGVIGAAMSEFGTSANMAFAMYPGLTQGAIAAIVLHGT